MRFQSLLITAAVLTTTACAAATTQSTTAAPAEITAADISKANVANAYDAVDRLSRKWFRDISGTASGEVVVYLDGNQKLGGKETLRTIPAADVVVIRYLKSADAVSRYGSEASGGAIIVTRR
jgi:hypothetical protein